MPRGVAGSGKTTTKTTKAKVPRTSGSTARRGARGGASTEKITGAMSNAPVPISQGGGVATVQRTNALISQQQVSQVGNFMGLLTPGTPIMHYIHALLAGNSGQAEQWYPQAQQGWRQLEQLGSRLFSAGK